jgi:ABC-type molybdate transport system substrate-binding protein
LRKEGHFVDIDTSLYTPLLQAGVILKGKNEAAAKKFKDYFMSEEAKGILGNFGLSQ